MEKVSGLLQSLPQAGLGQEDTEKVFPEEASAGNLNEVSLETTACKARGARQWWHMPLIPALLSQRQWISEV